MAFVRTSLPDCGVRSASPLRGLPVGTLGVPHEVRMTVRKVCSRNSRFDCRGDANTVSELASTFGRPLDLVVLDGDLLARALFSVLGRVHLQLPAARVLLVGPPLELGPLARALRSGVRGVLPPDRLQRDLENAMETVAHGGLWLAPGELSNLLLRMSTEEACIDMPQLTARENVVVRDVLSGFSNKEVAHRLNISEHTVAIHLHHVYTKLSLHGRADLFIHRGLHP